MSGAASLADRLDRRIADEGPIPVSVYVDAALYDADAGFYTAGGGRAGRRADFLTAPEVGPLFGAVLARAVDSWWDDAGRPDRFVVEEWGAGPGTLARTIVAAAPEVLVAGALRWVQVERAASQRDLHLEHGALASVGPGDVNERVDVVIANELLDNLPFDVIERADDGWREVRVGPRDDTGRFTLVSGGAASGPESEGIGLRLPVASAAGAWVDDVRQRAAHVIALDYGAADAELLARDGAWLRTHVAHEGTADWLRDPGSCDITIDVPIDRLPVTDTMSTQAAFLRRHGIDELVEEGRRVWEASASVGDLAALKARSRVREADALLDPAGMGAFTVLEWRGS
ncbi:MAG: SAM-dependent methyltransferase [Actinomycetota bacterium]